MLLISILNFCRFLQGTSMEGPIPSTISQLKNLTELWACISLSENFYTQFMILFMVKIQIYKYKCLICSGGFWLSGWYLIWMEQACLFLICRIWRRWQDCELKMDIFYNKLHSTFISFWSHQLIKLLLLFVSFRALRDCLITGQIPPYLGEMKKLKIL